MAELNPEDLNLNEEQPKKDLSPIPLDDSDGPETQISHAPLNLGGGGSAPAARPTAAPKPAAPVKPVARQQVSAVSTDRISGVKIFFTKLHAGAMDFLSDQITEWLAANPDVVIKRTNATVGEVAAKKTEPNLIITVWY